MDKKEIRKAVLEKRRLIIDKEQKSRVIQQRVIEACKEYKNIGIYMNTPYEVETVYCIEELQRLGKNIYIPSVVGDCMEFRKFHAYSELKKGKYGILESEGEVLNQLDCLVLPLVAFDANNNRLGMGKGYYDRFMSIYKIPYCIGIAFEEQRLDAVPMEAHDVSLDCIITENKIYL